MISDSSLYSGEPELSEDIEKLVADNDLEGQGLPNYYGRTVHAFPYLKALVALSKRLNAAEKELRKRGVDR